uniref:Desmoplakin protein n=1 Tax=Spodoptera frugiperda nuclear polyhedrosis virus TaxID=10455 RepID=A0A0R5RHS7_NPVSF|nr:desmoplakin protein [Spodoptera frugiperda multiple nucleopolyhedrovirus]
MSYRNPKYKNTDVSAGTVQNLLQTINNMSQRCRGQANTEDIVQRVRSIILMYRPHLANRIDLQLPELTMEALMPNSMNANQITHNFNYKYDYNSNVPNAYNPFLPPPQQPMQMPNASQQQPTPLQSFTINAAPPPPTTTAAPTVAESSTTLQPPPPAPTTAAVPTTTTTVVSLPSIDQSDLASLNVLYVNAQRTPSVTTYKQLLRQIVYLVRKYVRYEQITLSLELLETFDSIQINNDIDELLLCIERETGWALPNGPNVCRLISFLISSFCRIIAKITKQELVLSAIKTEERLRAVMSEIEVAVVNVINAPPPAPVPQQPIQTYTPEVEALKNQQIELLKNTIEQQQIEITRLQTKQTMLQQQYDSAESKSMILNNVNEKLRIFYRSHVGSAPPADDQQFVGNLIQYFENLETSNAQAITNVNQQNELLSQQTQSYNQMQQQYNELRQQYNQVESTYKDTINQLTQNINEKDSYIASVDLKLSSFEDAQSQLRAAQTKNTELQSQVKSINDKYNNILEEYKALKKKTGAIKPIRKVKAIRRPDAQTINSKLIAETQQLLNDQKVKNQQMQEIKNRYNENIESTTKVIEIIKNELQKTRLQVESLISNQAALSVLDFKALNKKSTQNLADEVSLLRAENQAVKETCNMELNRESIILQERLEDSKVNISNKIDKLIEQVAPLQNRIEQSAADIEEFKTRIETMARKEAIRPK